MMTYLTWKSLTSRIQYWDINKITFFSSQFSKSRHQAGAC
jgi:hypothetical protein